MEEKLLLSFKELIARKTGLRIRCQDNNSLKRIVDARMKARGIDSAHEYFCLLESDSTDSVPEKKELIELLTVGESYFFRDDGQFRLLTNVILPDIIKKKEPERSIKIWSAGCSTGEEPYSLAMTLDGLIPDISCWKVFILGTDIKKEFLERASAGLYREWSFRTMRSEARRKYFLHNGDAWEIDGRIRRMVTFRQGDLLADAYPNFGNNLYDMDLILCRNVFIYYGSDAIAEIAEKMSRTLANGGYLVSGHNELFAVQPGLLRPRLFPESMVYVRDDRRLLEKAAEPRGEPFAISPERLKISLPPIPRPPAPAPQKVEAARKGPEGPLQDAQDSRLSELAKAETYISSGRYMEAIGLLERLMRDKALDFTALYLTGAAYANLGEYGSARDFLGKAIAADRFSIEPYFMLAHIAVENGALNEARDYFKKVIYLDPACASAYMEIAAVYESAGDAKRARKMRQSALEILSGRPVDEVVKPYEGATAGELVAYLKGLSG